MKPAKPFDERYTVCEDTGCWIWQDCLGKDGYGLLKVNGKMMGAHRRSFELYVEPIPEGMWVCHTCDNPPCVNPDHLFLGRNIDNVRDCVDKGRNILGSKHPVAKLHEDDIPRIRDMLCRGERQADIASWFGVTQSLISRINRKVSWPHVS